MKTENVEKSTGKIVLPSVKNIIVIASGKGGVGKSTIAANLAIALSKKGLKIALVDADVYGPSIPNMFNIAGVKMRTWNKNGRSIQIPIEKYGIKLLSFGFLVDPEEAIFWEGKIAANYLIQLIEETDWGEIDYMIVDLPPDTGEIPLIIAQSLELTGAIVVTSPQSIAFSDVIKASKMFINESINVPIIGIVENMAFLLSHDEHHEKRYLFGKGCGEIISHQLDVPLMVQIPISQKICESGEMGDPLAHSEESLLSALFDALANNILAFTPTFHEHYY